FGRLRNFRRDMVLVAAAGPAMNILLAVASAVVLALLETILYQGLDGPFGTAVAWLAVNLYNSIWINVLLAVFNMLPIPPLDGGRVAVGILPTPLALPLPPLARAG